MLSTAEQANASFKRKFIERGEKERMKEHLREALGTAWRDGLKKHCTEFVQEKGVEAVTIDDLASDLIPLARATVPDELKTDLFNQLRVFAESM
eukprot:CAMPEP_0194536634 /NCGR_PEP_ID=MMETSP0253-20130528/75637_1 /TAXON_ID=2966 /ORGANISM="Noctiluca scintillans" /LENGTH=93 /DNA_ID=CAMNT_0039382573 /DNA_START=60 /DNA_END=341 /DNA_ORIENTATION=-